MKGLVSFVLPRVLVGSETLWKSVDEGYVGFHLESGETRVFSPLAQFIFELIGESTFPVSMGAILNEVESASLGQEAEQLESVVESTVQALVFAELIQQVTSADA